MSEFRGRELKIIIAVFLLSGSFLFFGNVKKVSATFLNSYNKAYNGTLAASEWNNLALDFLNRDGSATMTGPLGIGTTTAPVSGLYVNGPIYATNFSGGAFTGLIDAANVMGGSGSSFGSNSGGGNYSFPASLGVGTTNPGAALHVIYPYVKTDTTRRDAFLVTTNEVNNPFQFRVQIQGDATDAGRVVNLQTTTAGLLNGGNLIFQANGGNVGIGTTAPNDTFSIGAAPAGSAGTGHNFTSTYLSTDDYALTNYGLVKTLISNATSTLVAGNLWNGTLNGNIYNGTAGAGNVGIGTTTPNNTYQGLTIYGSNPSLSLTGNGPSSWNWIQYMTSAGVNNFSSGVNQAGYYGIVAGAGMDNPTLSINSAKDVALGNSFNGLTFVGATMVIKAAGDVGIGTTSPLAKLHVYSASGYGQIITEAAGGNFLTFRTTAAPASDTWTQFIDSSNGFNFYSSQSPAGTKLTINTAGSVGIGTTAPGYQLDLSGAAANRGIRLDSGYANGSGNAYGDSRLVSLTSGGGLFISQNVDESGNLDDITRTGQAINMGFGVSGIRFNSYSAGANPRTASTDMFIKDDGNIGIGTTVPNDTLSIGNSGAAPAGSSKTGHNYTSTYLSTDDYALTNYGLVKTLIGNATSTLVAGNLWNGTLNGNIYNGTAGAGNVGIGTTAPGAKTHIVGASTVLEALRLENDFNIAQDRGTKQTFYIPHGTASTRLGGEILVANDIVGGTGSYMAFYNETNNAGATSEKMRINKYGYVGIGTTAPAYSLEVNGTFKVSTSSSSIILDSGGNISIGL